MKLSLTLGSAASVLLVSALAIGNTSPGTYSAQSEGGARPTHQEAQAAEKQEVTGKIEAVDQDQSVVQVQGTSVPIVTTSSTRYSRGLSFKSLKPGMDVKIVAVLRSDGKLEALEVRSA